MKIKDPNRCPCLRWLFITVYSVILEFIAWPIIKIASHFFDSFDRQSADRKAVTSVEYRMHLAKLRRRHSHSVVFLCSSAGEFEQAKPLIDRLKKSDIFSHVFFFSRSGFDFVKARGETCSYSLAPFDSAWRWGHLFSALQPDIGIIVRHEFWPGFMTYAQQWGCLCILDAVPPSMLGREPRLKTQLSAWLKRRLFSKSDLIFAVNSDGRSYYADKVRISTDRIFEIGDTKYDRVLERLQDIQERATLRSQQLRALWLTSDERVIILGSAHHADVKLCLEAWKHSLFKSTKLLIVPHDLSSGNLDSLEELTRRLNVRCEYYSDVQDLITDNSKISSDVIIVDSLGQLSELYAAADIAWIGGALHAKIHNVLEPAAWGLPLSSGPRFNNSEEARRLVVSGLLAYADSAEQVSKIWERQLQEKDTIKQQMQDHLNAQSGASDRFIGIAKRLNLL